MRCEKIERGKYQRQGEGVGEGGEKNRKEKGRKKEGRVGRRKGRRREYIRASCRKRRARWVCMPRCCNMSAIDGDQAIRVRKNATGS